MHYVYILKSESSRTRFYVGSTSDLKWRVDEHNRGDSNHTARFCPWKLINYFASVNRKKAEEFEAYLTTCSGRKFQTLHFGA